MHPGIIILAVLLVIGGCSKDIDQRAEERLQDVGRLPTQEILFVDDHKAPCTGVGPRECLQVRSDNEKAWQLFYSNIEGFEFEPGFRYELLVMVSKVENPPQDASSMKYKLMKVIGKTPSSATQDDATLNNLKTD